MDKTPLLLSTAYLPSIEYFSKILLSPEVFFETHENFVKQTYRNRCRVLGANSLIDLVIPVEQGRGKKIAIKDIRIFNQTEWQRNHWRTIFSAYNSSPFFEYYKEDFSPFYEKKWNFLFDFNMVQLETIIKILEISTIISLTSQFEKKPEGKTDLRSSISPKVKSTASFAPYTQVFSEKYGFIPNLSIIDLIFNMGPESLAVLEKGCGDF